MLQRYYDGFTLFPYAGSILTDFTVFGSVWMAKHLFEPMKRPIFDILDFTAQGVVITSLFGNRERGLMPVQRLEGCLHCVVVAVYDERIALWAEDVVGDNGLDLGQNATT